MGLLMRALLACILGLSATGARAADWQLSLDMRAIGSNGRESFLENAGEIRECANERRHRGLKHRNGHENS
jgi:hypothetical protein